MGNCLLRMVITDIVINVLLGRVTRHPAGMHCPSWDDAFVSSISCFAVCYSCDSIDGIGMPQCWWTTPY